MIVEKPREDFLQMIAKGDLPEGSWLAVCLFIVPEWPHDLKLSTAHQKALITYGKEILSIVDDGIFAQIGWTTFFIIARDEKESLSKKFSEAIVHFQAEDDYCRLWRYTITEINDRGVQEVFTELEWQSYDAARQEGKNL